MGCFCSLNAKGFAVDALALSPLIASYTSASQRPKAVHHRRLGHQCWQSFVPDERVAVQWPCEFLNARMLLPSNCKKLLSGFPAMRARFRSEPISYRRMLCVNQLLHHISGLIEKGYISRVADISWGACGIDQQLALVASRLGC